MAPNAFPPQQALTYPTFPDSLVDDSVEDDSPADIRLFCLHLDVVDPWRRSCANFDGELTYTVSVPPDEPVVLQLRASLEFLTPFQLRLETISS